MADFEINTQNGPAVSSKFGEILLADLLILDRATGLMTWQYRPATLSVNLRSHNAWNSRFAGQPALTCRRDKGYLCGEILSRSTMAHRVVFAMHTGSWPVNFIDHINGEPADNRPENLRDVSIWENSRNVKKYSVNTSGTVGVGRVPHRAKWRAAICVDGKEKFLGHFDCVDDAISARAKANIEYGFHANHGRSLTPTADKE